MVDYKNYVVWQRSHQLVLDVYSATEKFPKSEQFGIASQLNRAVLSIPTNIAEGCGRETQKELVRFLYIASGSAHEADYLLLVSKDLNFLDETIALPLINELDEIKKMLASLIRTIKKSIT